MKPAFSSTSHAARFALLIVATLLAPVFVARTGWLDRRSVYPAIPVKYGPFSFIQREIFDRPKDIDIAFMGSSYIWNAINAPYVQKKLSEKLGREAVVVSLNWPWSGSDAVYVIGRDLLQHRRVRLLVIYDEAGGDDTPHWQSSRWFRIGENSEALAGLSVIAQARLYGGAVLGMPRHLLSLVRPNLMEDPEHCHENFFNTYFHAPNLAQNLGSLCAHLGYNASPEFIAFDPPTRATPANVVVYSEATRSAFSFDGPSTQPYPLHFVKLLAELCRQNGTDLVFLHPPTLAERTDRVIHERTFWPGELSVPVDMVGIPPSQLYAGIPQDEVKDMFFENAHMNINGQDMFTRLVTPALIQLYERASNGH